MHTFSLAILCRYNLDQGGWWYEQSSRENNQTSRCRYIFCLSKSNYSFSVPFEPSVLSYTFCHFQIPLKITSLRICICLFQKVSRSNIGCHLYLSPAWHDCLGNCAMVTSVLLCTSSSPCSMLYMDTGAAVIYSILHYALQYYQLDALQ